MVQIGQQAFILMAGHLTLLILMMMPPSSQSVMGPQINEFAKLERHCAKKCPPAFQLLIHKLAEEHYHYLLNSK